MERARRPSGLTETLKIPTKLRRDAVEAALIRDLATDSDKREMFDRLHQHLSLVAEEVERAMKSDKPE